jgi:hypothetical protein
MAHTGSCHCHESLPLLDCHLSLWKCVSSTSGPSGAVHLFATATGGPLLLLLVQVQVLGPSTISSTGTSTSTVLLVLPVCITLLANSLIMMIIYI